MTVGWGLFRSAGTKAAAIEKELRKLRERPYAPGWLDRVLDRVDRMRAHNGLVILGLLVFEVAWVIGVMRLRGTPVAVLDLRQIFIVLIAPYLLGVRYYLDRMAGQAMDTFRPALDVDDEEFHRLRYELTTLPADVTWVITGVAVVAYVANAALLPDWIVLQFGPTRFVSALLLVPVALLTMAIVAICTAQAIRQLVMVDLIHGLTARIHLFRTKPLYAFSALTARTGMSFLLMAYYIAAVRPEVVGAAPGLRLLVVALIPTAIACFVLPLHGMHVRLAAEKDRLLADAGVRLETLLARLHQRIETETLADADKLNNQLSSVIAEREALGRVSTWPWDVTTVTAFLTTLVLPVALWLVQRLLTRMGV